MHIKCTSTRTYVTQTQNKPETSRYRRLKPKDLNQKNMTLKPNPKIHIYPRLNPRLTQNLYQTQKPQNQNQIYSNKPNKLNNPSNSKQTEKLQSNPSQIQEKPKIK